MAKSFKDYLEEEHLKKIKVEACQIIVGIDNISISSKDATIEEAEKLWPILEASLDINKGYGLAAIQIGIPKKIAIINYNGKILHLLNTRIVEGTVKTVIYNEGCLSIPGKTVHTERYAHIKISDDVLGDVEFNASTHGLLPIIFQHEVDHFEGKTIFDYVRRPVRSIKGPGRNDPCPCKSGKKYKKCCIDKDIS